MYDLELENYVYPQDTGIMYYLELEKNVYPKILVLCIIQYLRIMFTPRLADQLLRVRLTIEMNKSKSKKDLISIMKNIIIVLS